MIGVELHYTKEMGRRAGSDPSVSEYVFSITAIFSVILATKTEVDAEFLSIFCLGW